MTNMRGIKEIAAFVGTDSYRMTCLKEVPAFAGSDSYRMTNMKEIKEIPASAGIAMGNTYSPEFKRSVSYHSIKKQNILSSQKIAILEMHKGKNQ